MKTKTCKHRRCEETITGRKHYCSDHCKYWEGVMRHEEEKHLPPKYKRNSGYFYMYCGSRIPRGAGRRNGSSVRGAMSGYREPILKVVETTIENLEKHFQWSGVYKAELCDGSFISRDDFENRSQNQGAWIIEESNLNN